MATSTLRGPIPADNVIYDNTQSGMTATDVQDAIDELNAEIGNLFVEMTLAVDEAVQASEPLVKDLGACPSGYMPVSVYLVRNAGSNLLTYSTFLYNGHIWVTIANNYTQDGTVKGTLHVVLRKTS